MKVRDNFLTKERFKIIKNKSGFLETIPQPKKNDINKYYKSEKYLSHTDSKKSFFDKIYQIAKEINLREKKKIIKNYVKKGMVLDYGCGVGDFLNYIKNDYEINGIEPNENAAKIASTKLGLLISNNTNLSNINDGKYDLITLWHVFEHVHELDMLSKELFRILKKEGTLIIAVPNYKSYDAEYYAEYWAAYDVPRHLWHFNRESLIKWWDKYEMKIIDIKPMKLDSYYVSILSEKYRNKNIFSFIKGIIIGLLSNLKARKTNEYSSLIYVFKKKC